MKRIPYGFFGDHANEKILKEIYLCGNNQCTSRGITIRVVVDHKTGYPLLMESPVYAVIPELKRLAYDILIDYDDLLKQINEMNPFFGRTVEKKEWASPADEFPPISNNRLYPLQPDWEVDLIADVKEYNNVYTDKFRCTRKYKRDLERKEGWAVNVLGRANMPKPRTSLEDRLKYYRGQIASQMKIVIE